MKASCAQSNVFYLLVCIMTLISGCSETTKEAPPLPDVVFPVSFPLIEESKLYSLEANAHFGLPAGENETNAFDLKQTLLLEIPSGLLLALDTDLSDKGSDDGEDAFTNTALPEFIAYVDEDKQTLRLYDLDTRRDHELFSFENDSYTDAMGEESTETEQTVDEADVNTETGISRYICDIQKVVTWDEEARLAKTILYKDELAVYVKTSTNETCSESEEGYEYWQINIVESSETFTIRRRTLKSHTHEHKHFHDHDDPDYEFADIHNHQHLLEEGELDENGLPFDPKNHTHRHNHSHEFIYSFHHEHDHLDQEEIDAVHTDPLNHEITFKTYPVLVGRKSSFTSIDEALMYSGKPVVNVNARTFGYLGLNSKEDALKFYTVDLDTLEKRLLWSEQHESMAELENATTMHTDWRALVPKHTRLTNHSEINGEIALFTDTRLFTFNLDNLFDDDLVIERRNSLNKPWFASSYANPVLKERVHYNASNNKLVLVENNQLWQIDFDNEQPSAVMIRTFSDPNLSSIEAKMMATDIMVIKRFNTEQALQTSITAIQESGLEVMTVISKTEDEYSAFKQGENTFLNIKSSDPDQALTADILLGDFGSPFLAPLRNSIWLQGAVDYRSFLEKEPVVLFRADQVSSTPGTIQQPSAYILDITEPDGKGEQLTQVETLNAVSGMVIFNEFYSIVEYKDPQTESILESIIKYQ